MVSASTCPTCYGVSSIAPHLFLSTHLGASLLSPLPPPPARFLLPLATVRSESCAYDTSVCCHGNRGGLRLERGAQGSGPSATCAPASTGSRRALAASRRRRDSPATRPEPEMKRSRPGAAARPDLGGGTGRRKGWAAGGEARELTAWSLALSGPRGPLPARQPRGGAAGLPKRRRQLCSAPQRAGLPERRGEVVAVPDFLKLSLTPAAHAAGTASSAFASLGCRHRESLRNRTSGASHHPRLLSAQGPSLETTAGLQGRCPRPGPTWEARARSERPGRAVTDRWLHWSADWTLPRQSGRSWRRVPAQGMKPASAKLYSGEA